MLKRSQRPKLLSKLLLMKLLLEVWLPSRLPLLSLPPTHMLLVSPSMVWDMLAFPTLVLDWVTMVLVSPTLDFLCFLLLLLPRNEHFFLFSLLFWFFPSNSS